MKRRVIFFVFALFVILLFVKNIIATPSIDFVAPVPDNETVNRSVELNATINDSYLYEAKFGINGVNHTISNLNLSLFYNLNNLSALGENITHIKDLSGNGRNGTAVGAIFNSTGKYGGGFTFDGLNDYVNTTYKGINTASNFTISFWMNTKTPNYTYPIAVNDATGYIYVRAQIDTINRLEFLVSDGVVSIGARLDTALWRNGNWHQLTFTKSGNTADYLNIYIDGSAATFTRPFNGTVGSHVMTQDFFLGAINYQGAALAFFNATFDDLRIYNRALSATEISDMYILNLNEYDLSLWNLDGTFDLNLKNNSYFTAASNLSGSENMTSINSTTLLCKTTKYYDNRKAAVVVTADDYAGRASNYLDYFIDSIDTARDKKLIISQAVTTGQANTNDTDWEALQTELNEGYVSISSHSVNHPHFPYAGNTTIEVCDSQRDIIGNLTLPWQDKFNGSEFITGWVEPYGETDTAQRGNLSACNYLIDRSVSYAQSLDYYASWNSTGALFDRIGVTAYGFDASLATMNTNFTNAYNNGGIYHLWIHPYQHNWTGSDIMPQHFSYIGNRTDVWYVGWGELYMYHYLENVSEPTLNISTRTTQEIVANITVSGTDRNKYGLTYPITYSFYLPAFWNKSFAYYKNNSGDSYTAMTEGTDDEYWNGVDEFRNNASENVIYISKSLPQTSNGFYLRIIPILQTNFNTSTSTDLTVSSIDLSNITNLTLENTSYGKVNFSETVNLSAGASLDRDVIIADKYISINTTNLPSLNKPATISLYNINYGNPVIYRNGELCSSAICTKINYSNNIYTFNVTGFSTYSINCTESWSCTAWSGCSGSEQTRTCTDGNSCGTILTKPALSQSCTGGSGPSGGSTPSGIVTPPIVTATPTQTEAIPSIPASQPVEVKITNSNLEVTSITISTTEAVAGEQVTVEEVKTLPPPEQVVVGICLGEGQGKVYTAFSITLKKTNNNIIANATIDFRVNKTWFSENNGTLEDLNLFRQNPNTKEWGVLSTSFVKEDESYLYFESKTPGFSTFAVLFSKCKCAPNAKRCFNNDLQICVGNAAWLVTEKCGEGCLNATTCIAPAQQKSVFSQSVIVATTSVGALIVLAVLYLILMRIKKKKRTRKRKK